MKAFAILTKVFVILFSAVAIAEPDMAVMEAVRAKLTQPSQLKKYFAPRTRTSEETQLAIVAALLARAKQGHQAKVKAPDYRSLFLIIAHENSRVPTNVRQAAVQALTEIPGSDKVELVVRPAFDPKTAAPGRRQTSRRSWSIEGFEAEANTGLDEVAERVAATPGLKEEISRRLITTYVNGNNFALFQRAVTAVPDLSDSNRSALVVLLRERLTPLIANVESEERLFLHRCLLKAQGTSPLEGRTVQLLALLQLADQTAPRQIVYWQAPQSWDGVGTARCQHGSHETGFYLHNDLVRFLSDNTYEQLENSYRQGDPEASQSACRLLSYSAKGFTSVWADPVRPADKDIALDAFHFSNEIGAHERKTPYKLYPNDYPLVHRMDGPWYYPGDFSSWEVGIPLASAERALTLTLLSGTDPKLKEVGVLASESFELVQEEIAALVGIIADTTLSEGLRHRAADRFISLKVTGSEVSRFDCIVLVTMAAQLAQLPAVPVQSE